MWIFIEFFPLILMFFVKFKNQFTSAKSLILYAILLIFIVFFYFNALGIIYYLIALSIFVALVFFVNEKDYGGLNHLPHFVKIDDGMDVCYFKTALLHKDFITI